MWREISFVCGRRDETVYLEDMIGACEQILIFARGWGDEELLGLQSPYRGAILHQLTILGEAAKYVGAERRKCWSGIPWQDITGMRDKIVHYYQGINDAMVLTTVRASVPALLPRLREMLARIDEEYPQP
jgi:uncharacterized protein with HEPN domain